MLVEGVTRMNWTFSDNPPKMKVGLSGRHEVVDPTPAYHHDYKLVRDESIKVYESLPVRNEPVIYVLSRESVTRCNGWAEQQFDYDDEDGVWHGVIGMSGKRVPPHTEMTKYLVAHEYGHHIEFELARIRDCETDDIRTEYAALRGGKKDYGPGAWDTNVGELFANDFRILVANVQHDFWPHPYSHPTELKELINWWADVQEEIRKANA